VAHPAHRAGRAGTGSLSMAERHRPGLLAPKVERLRPPRYLPAVALARGPEAQQAWIESVRWRIKNRH